jgi:Lipid A 3-O-deacylase (PagL)
MPRRSDRRFDCRFGHNYLSLLAALCLLAPQVALCQEKENAGVTNTSLETKAPVETEAGAIKVMPQEKPRVESELAAATMISYGNYRIFGAAPRCNVWATGVEYSRHSWGHLLKARVDYMVEILPFVILSEPAKADFWGNPESPDQQLVHGLALSPFGFRFLWRGNRTVKPFLIGKAGVIAFPKKILSPDSTYANFNFQGDFGLAIRMSDRVDLRMSPVVYFHVSNGYLAASNPGFDQLGAKFGVSYHLGKGER